MTRLPRALAACVLPLALLMTSALPAAALTAAQDEEIVVELDRDRLQAGPGEKFSFESTIENNGDSPLTGYVAHLNILTTDEGVYVDPEDWSPERTQYIETLRPGESAKLTWTVQAVTSGPLILYVSATSPTTDTVTSSGPLNLTVKGQRVVSSAAVVPLVVWVPAGVLALLGANLLRRRRHR